MKARKIFTFALALVMLFSLAAPVFAEGEKTYRDYEYYLNIGDSIARGCGLEWNDKTAKDYPVEKRENNYYSNDWNNLFDNETADTDKTKGGNNYEGSFPRLVAEAIEKEKADGNLQYMGMRSVEAYYALGGELFIDDFNDTAEDNRGDFAYNLEDITTHRDVFQKYAEQADLITLQLGSNDLYYSGQVIAGITDPSILSGGAEAIGDVLTTYIAWIADGFEKLQYFYPKILERIKDLQGEEKFAETDIVLVGIYNPMSNCPVVDEVFLPLGEALNFMADGVNCFLRSLADQYPNVYYADIANVETPLSSGTITLLEALSPNDDDPRFSTHSTHPTNNGYAYIARQILDVLPEEDVCYPETFIRFNLPNEETVTGVKLGSREARFIQSEDGTKLIVPNYSPFAQSMTVTGKTEDGKTVVYVYKLNYKLGEGYTAHRITGTNDLVLSLSRVMNGMASILNIIITAVQGLFNS